MTECLEYQKLKMTAFLPVPGVIRRLSTRQCLKQVKLKMAEYLTVPGVLGAEND